MTYRDRQLIMLGEARNKFKMRFAAIIEQLDGDKDLGEIRIAWKDAQYWLGEADTLEKRIADIAPPEGSDA